MVAKKIRDFPARGGPVVLLARRSCALQPLRPPVDKQVQGGASRSSCTRPASEEITRQVEAEWLELKDAELKVAEADIRASMAYFAPPPLTDRPEATRRSSSPLDSKSFSNGSTRTW